MSVDEGDVDPVVVEKGLALGSQSIQLIKEAVEGKVVGDGGVLARLCQQRACPHERNVVSVVWAFCGGMVLVGGVCGLVRGRVSGVGVVGVVGG